MRRFSVVADSSKCSVTVVDAAHSCLAFLSRVGVGGGEGVCHEVWMEYRAGWFLAKADCLWSVVSIEPIGGRVFDI
jgi:hypothetical protein